QTTQEELPLLSVEEFQDEQLLLSVNDQVALKNGNKNTAILKPFGLYTIAKTDKKVILKKY
ncbi:MAG: hypothetical protein HKN61_01425, partial [Flavobacteriaceae bacterium]|nr:hypothetical protein [Flavobacteriaceae bacterium]